MEEHRATWKKTLLLTDDRCLNHAGFKSYQNVYLRQNQKKEQPENAERLIVLTNEKNGVLTVAEEFVSDRAYKVRNSVRQAPHGDIFRVHDYNYLKKVIKMSKKLKMIDMLGANSEIMRFGKID